MCTFGVYIVYEHKNYKHFYYGRQDVGTFYVETKYFDDLREFMKFSTGFKKEVIDEIVFFDEEEANQVAVERTLEKLKKVQLKKEKE